MEERAGQDDDDIGSEDDAVTIRGVEPFQQPSNSLDTEDTEDVAALEDVADIGDVADAEDVEGAKDVGSVEDVIDAKDSEDAQDAAAPTERDYESIGGGVAARYRELCREQDKEDADGQDPTGQPEENRPRSEETFGNAADDGDVDGVVVTVDRVGSPIGSLLSATDDSRSIQVCACVRLS